MRCGCWEALQNRSVHHLRSSQGHCGPLSTESISKYLPQLGLVPGCQGANREQKGSQGYSMNPALRSCSSVPSPAPFLGEQLTDISRSFGLCFVSPWCLHVLCGPRGAAQGLRAALRGCGLAHLRLHSPLCACVWVPTLPICLRLRDPSGPPWFPPPRVVSSETAIPSSSSGTLPHFSKTLLLFSSKIYF